MPINYVRVKNRKDTHESWAAFNPILLDGELIIVEKDGQIKFKLGDGVTAYNDLSFIEIGSSSGDNGSGDDNNKKYTWESLKDKFTWDTLNYTWDALFEHTTN